MMIQRIGNLIKGWSLTMLLGVALLPAGAIAMDPLGRLDEATIAEEMLALPGWITDGQQISCLYEFENFVEAIAFVNRLVDPAEAIGHHPDLIIRYNQVEVNLTTHDAGGLTSLDFAVALQLERCPSPGV